MKPNLRLATLGDVPAIMQVVSKAVAIMNAAGNFQWDETYPNPAYFGADIAKGDLWLAEEEGCVLGVIALTTEIPAEYAEAGWSVTDPALVPHRLVVDPSVRGRGLALLLMGKAEERARELGLAKIRVDTSAVNTAMHRIFRKLGYVQKGKMHQPDCGDLLFLCYEKLL